MNLLVVPDYFFSNLQNNWKQFDRSPIIVPHSNQTYHTWLDDAEFSTPMKFETLSHVTTFENAENILMQRELRSHRINDYSCVTKFRHNTVHPLYSRKGLWVTPDTYSTIVMEKYGNIRFYTNNLEFLKNLNCYIFEYLDDGDGTTCRVLVTNQTYPELRPLDINSERNGPIYLDPKTNQFVKYKLFKRRHWPQYEHCDIEVFLEIPEPVNTLISYVQCQNPKTVIKNEQLNAGTIEGFSDEIGEIKYALFRYRHRFNSSFFINPLDPHCQSAILTIKNVELTSQWYPLERKKYFHSNNCDKLIKSLCFTRSFCNGEIMAEDEAVIEDLDFAFNESGEVRRIMVLVFYCYLSSRGEAFNLKMTLRLDENRNQK